MLTLKQDLVSVIERAVELAETRSDGHRGLREIIALLHAALDSIDNVAYWDEHNGSPRS